MNKFFLDQDFLDLNKWTKHKQNFYNNKKILILGYNGFLGKYITEYFNFISQNNKIKVEIDCVDNFKSSQKNSNFHKRFSKKFSFYNKDVYNFNSNKKYDVIFYLAGIASPKIYAQIPLETLEVSYNGTKKFLEKAKKDGSLFVFFSSSEIYGNPDKKFIPTPENYYGYVNSFGPRSCYDEGKRVAETLCYIYKNYQKVNLKILRPFNVFGPGMDVKDYRIMPNIIRNITNNTCIKIFGNGNQTRTFCYISEAIASIILIVATKSDETIFNIGNSKDEISIKNLVKKFENILNKKIKYKFSKYTKSYPGDEPQRRCPDLSRFYKATKFKSKISLDSAIKKNLEFFKII